MKYERIPHNIQLYKLYQLFSMHSLYIKNIYINITSFILK